MNIAIDYDGTFAADPTLFRLFVTIAEYAGHTCLIVTHRDSRHAKEIQAMVGPGTLIIFASGISKIQAARDADWPIDIWIDDDPEGIPRELIYMGDMDNHG